MDRVRALCIALSLAVSQGALADGISSDAATPRSIGRAGANLVSDDGISAIWQNPAVLSRRSTARLQLGGVVRDSDLSYVPEGVGARIGDQSAADAIPSAGFAMGFGSVTLGIAYLEGTRIKSELTRPEFSLIDDDLIEFFPHRYGGLGFEFRRRGLAAAASVRVGESLAIGLSGFAERFSISEARHIWAGFSGRDGLSNPSRDMTLELGGDGWGAGAALSVYYAPFEIPFEFALSVTGRGSVSIDGDAALAANRSDGPVPNGANGDASTELPPAMTVRPGIRYSGERLGVEASANIHLVNDDGDPPIWDTNSIGVMDESGVSAPVGRLRSRLSHKSHVSVQGAVEYNVVEGLLWLVSGYRFHTAASLDEYVSPGYGDIGGHTIAAGVEAYWNDIAFSIGYARTFSAALSSTNESAILQDNPFSAGSEIAAPGRFDRAADAFGLSAEFAWE